MANITTAYPKRSIVLADSLVDAFGRLRTGDPAGIFASQNQYDTSPFFWESKITNTSGNAAVTHLPLESGVQLSVEAEDTIIRQTRAYHRYQPGKSQLILLTYGGYTQVADVTRRMGYFDALNGVFFEDNGTDQRWVLRSNVSGTPVDTAVSRSDWSIDKFNGNGASRVDLDVTGSQIPIIDLEWLGVGRVRCGFVVDGQIYYAHHFNNANNQPTVYMTTANLPIRYELSAAAGVAGAHTLTQICSQVSSEGGQELELGIPRGAGNGITTTAVTTRRPILSLRAKAAFNGIVNRGLIIPEMVDVFVQTNSAYIEVVYGGTLTGATFAVDPGGIAEVDTAATTITGGTVIRAHPVSTSGSGTGARGGEEASLLSRLPLTLDIDGSNAIPISVVATSFTLISDVSATFNWREVYA